MVRATYKHTKCEEKPNQTKIQVNESNGAANNDERVSNSLVAKQLSHEDSHNSPETPLLRRKRVRRTVSQPVSLMSNEEQEVKSATKMSRYNTAIGKPLTASVDSKSSPLAKLVRRNKHLQLSQKDAKQRVKHMSFVGVDVNLIDGTSSDGVKRRNESNHVQLPSHQLTSSQLSPRRYSGTQRSSATSRERRRRDEKVRMRLTQHSGESHRHINNINSGRGQSQGVSSALQQEPDSSQLRISVGEDKLNHPAVVVSSMKTSKSTASRHPPTSNRPSRWRNSFAENELKQVERTSIGRNKRNLKKHRPDGFTSKRVISQPKKSNTFSGVKPGNGRLVHHSSYIKRNQTDKRRLGNSNRLRLGDTALNRTKVKRSHSVMKNSSKGL